MAHPSDELIARSLAGETTPEEERSLQAWRAQSPEHEQRYSELARLAALASGLPGRLVVSDPPTLAEVLQRKRPVRSRVSRPAPVWRRAAVRWPLAAAAMIVLALGMTRLLTTGAGTESDPDYAVKSFVTGPVEPATVTFRDGTVIRLAPDSRLGVYASGAGRRVNLNGRAYFAVATATDGRPFVIETPAGQVRVLGTRFDISARPENLEVVVVEGRVALSSEGVETEVVGGQMGRVVNGKPLPSVAVDDPHGRLDWVGRFLAFHDTPLATAAREIEREYGVRVEITDRDLAERTITTWFSGWEIDDVMTVFCTIAEAHCTTGDQVIAVSPLRPAGP